MTSAVAVDDAQPRQQVHTKSRLLDAALEFALVFGLFAIYKFGRRMAMAHTGSAHANAEWAHTIDRYLSWPSTPNLQLDAPDWLLHDANVYYTSVHFPLTTAFVIGCYALAPRREYLRMRDTLVLTTFTALLIELFVPLAPPRMFPQWGYEDTMNVIGPSAYSGHVGETANQLAAMPSLHVGWALIIALTAQRFGNRLVTVLGYTHFFTTWAVVTITANHWRIDGLVAIALVLGFSRLVDWFASRRFGRSDEAQPAHPNAPAVAA